MVNDLAVRTIDVNIDAMNVVHCHRVGNKEEEDRATPRDTIARFTTNYVTTFVIHSSRNLKGTPLFINEAIARWTRYSVIVVEV